MAKKASVGMFIGLIGAILALLFMVNQGWTPAGASAIYPILGGVAFSIIAGMIVYAYASAKEVNRFLSALSVFVLAFFLTGLIFLPFSTGMQRAFGLRVTPPPEKPAKEGYLMGTVMDELAVPAAGVPNASVTVYASEPKPGTSPPILATDNADSSGAFTTKIDGVYPGLDVWISASKSGFYAAKVAAEVKETKTPAAAKTLNALDQGTWDIDVIGVKNPDNISFADGENIKLDAGVDVVFDIYVRNGESESAIVNLYEELDEAAAFGSIGSWSFDYYKAEGVSVELEEGDPSLVTDDHAEYLSTGDLLHLKDTIRRVEITGTSGMGSGNEIATLTVDDLKDETDHEQRTGLTEDQIVIEIA